jgi:PEP-CTERM motif
MYRSLAVLVLSGLIALPLSAQITWNEPTGGNFLTASNWAGGVVPTSTDDVLIGLPGAYTIDLNGNLTIKSLEMNNLPTTFNHTGGVLNITNSFVNNNGVYAINGGTLNANGGIILNDGVLKLDLGGVLNLTGNLVLNSGPANGGYVQAISGTINGGSITSNHPNGRIDIVNLVLNNVAVGPNVIAPFGGDLTIRNGTTLPHGMNLETHGSLIIGPNQAGVQNFRVTFGYSSFVVMSLYGSADNASFTIGASGSPDAAVKLTGTAFNALYVGGGGVGINRSIVNTGIIENQGFGLSPLYISPSGNFTNSGVIRANSPGKVIIAPAGAFIISPGSSLISSNGGSFEIDTTNIQNAGLLVIRSNDLATTPLPTASVVNSSTATTTILGGATMSVGNNSVSNVTNSGEFQVNATAVLNVGTLATPGTYTNNGGTFTLNGTANSSVMVSGGRLTGSGTINALNSTSVVIGSGGTLAPGNSPGQIVIGGGLDVGGTLEIDIAAGGGNNSNTTGNNTTPGSGFDTIRVQPPPSNNTTTNATIRTQSTKFKLMTGNTLANFGSDSFWNMTQRWRFMNTTNGVIVLVDGNNNTLPSTGVLANVSLYTTDNLINPIDFTQNYSQGSFTYEILVNGNGNDLNLVWLPVPVPEPTTILGIAGLGLIAWRCRRCFQTRVENPVA